jgi:hypothetical protein
MRSPWLPNRLRISTGRRPALPNQCGPSGIEFGGLAWAEDDIVLGRHQPQ